MPTASSELNSAAGIRVHEITLGFPSESSQANAPVLKRLSLDVAPGEIVALLGASGCGKSTLLRAIAKLLRPQSGEIVFEPGPPNRRRGDLAYVFQDATLLPWRTVAENARLPLELQHRGRHGGTDVQLGEVYQTLESVGLHADTWARFPRELSGGMRMRTSLARALVTDPNVLLLDEPFAALDDLLRGRMNDLVLELWSQRRRTILFVTHNIAEAVYLSHRIAILSAGRVTAIMENTLAWPRTARMRSSVEFATFYGRVSAALAEAPGI